MNECVYEIMLRVYEREKRGRALIYLIHELP